MTKLKKNATLVQKITIMMLIKKLAFHAQMDKFMIHKQRFAILVSITNTMIEKTKFVNKYQPVKKESISTPITIDALVSPRVLKEPIS